MKLQRGPPDETLKPSWEAARLLASADSWGIRLCSWDPGDLVGNDKGDAFLTLPLEEGLKSTTIGGCKIIDS